MLSGASITDIVPALMVEFYKGRNPMRFHHIVIIKTDHILPRSMCQPQIPGTCNAQTLWPGMLHQSGL